jgi:hypothetical protein
VLNPHNQIARVGWGPGGTVRQVRGRAGLGEGNQALKKEMGSVARSAFRAASDQALGEAEFVTRHRNTRLMRATVAGNAHSV